jgi:hypothetical protein
MRIYVASSWRNENAQQNTVAALRAAGHDVYDFRNPKPGDNGFAWRQIDPDRDWLKDPARFRVGLEHPVAQHGFRLDMSALTYADATVLVLPCGRSAHLELGYAVGAGQRTVVLLDSPMSEPELMCLACDALCVSIDEVLSELELPDPEHAVRRMLQKRKWDLIDSRPPGVL